MDTTTLEIGTTEWIGWAIAECNRMLAGITKWEKMHPHHPFI